MKTLFISILTLLGSLSAFGQTTAADLYLLVGTYTDQGSRGIYVYRFNSETGTAEYVSAAKTSNPSYLAVSTDETRVYAVNESGAQSAVTAFRFDKRKGKLKRLNSVPAGGEDPCYVSVDAQSRFVVTANYSSGQVVLFPLTDKGDLEPSIQYFQREEAGPDRQRQAASHIHCVTFSPDKRYLLATNLGGDCIYSFLINAGRPFLTLQHRTSVEPGTGPRHLTFSPDGRFAYLLGELSGKITAFNYADGRLNPIQVIAADTTAGAGGKGSADIHISPDGRFLYASNRLKADGIAIFRIHETDGTLTFIGYQATGIHPRNFILTPNGRYLLAANRDSNNIQIFRIDLQTGLLTETGQPIPLSRPVCLKFVGRK